MNKAQFVSKIANTIISSDRQKIVLTVGCGGSHAIASHFSAELVGTFMNKERKAYPSISLFSDPTITSAISNDFSFEKIGQRFLDSFAKTALMLVAFTTSGKSQVIVNSLNFASQNDIPTFLITGPNKDQACLEFADYSFLSQFDSVSKIQEDHLALIHSICQIIEVTG